MLDGLLSYSRLLFATLRRSGGLIQASKTAWNIYHRRGLQGVREKIGILLNEFSHSRHSDISGHSYSEWIRRYEVITDINRSEMEHVIACMGHPPLISIVMPVYNPKPKWLKEAIESVKAQIYPNWELCIADDLSTNQEIRSLLEAYVHNEPRVKVVFRKENGHISAASNSALEISSGDWVALMDHDDLIPETALYWVAKSVVDNPYIQLLYTDEDKIDATGKRQSPYFKCDWNPDLFYSQNMFSHLGVFSRGILEAVGGFKEGMEGAQDFDLALRCVELVKPAEIYHIPRVLYHWRLHNKSTSRSGEAKPYAALAGERARKEHFKRVGIKAKAEAADHYFKVQYKLPKSLPLVSLIIHGSGSLEQLRLCIDSILEKTTYPCFEILLVGYGPLSAGRGAFSESQWQDPRIRVLKEESSLGFPALCNQASKQCMGELLGLVSDRIEVISPGWLEEMVSHALRPGVGAVGAKLLHPDGRLQHGGMVLGLGGVVGCSHMGAPARARGYFGRMDVVSNFSAVSGDCMLVNMKVYRSVNGLNAKDLPTALYDIDFCLRLIRAGYRNVWTPYAELYRQGQCDTLESEKVSVSEDHYFRKKWSDFVSRDPAYSPNLTLDSHDFSYAWPPRLEEFSPVTNITRSELLATGQSNLAVIVHAFYPDLLPDIISRLASMGRASYLYVTAPMYKRTEILKILELSQSKFYFLPVENHGRDVLPFLKIIPVVKQHNFELILKLHTKKSTKRNDGNKWREDVYKELMSPHHVSRIIQRFEEDDRLGMVGPQGHIISMTKYWGSNRRRVLKLASDMGISGNRASTQPFVAGTMFFARLSAIRPIEELGLTDMDFEVEAGQTDGTMAHVVERLFSIALIATNQELIGSDSQAFLNDINTNYEYTDR